MGVVNAVPCKADILIRRFPTADLPTHSDEEMQKWLIKLYQEKVQVAGCMDSDGSSSLSILDTTHIYMYGSFFRLECGLFRTLWDPHYKYS